MNVTIYFSILNLIPHTYLFGYQERIQLFKNYAHQDYLTLFFDYKNGNERITTLLKKLYLAMDSAEVSIKKGEKPTIDASYKTMLTVTEEKQDHQTIYHININASRLQKAMDGKGLYSIVTSEAMSPEEVHKLYSCRGVSETQYMQTKTQLGYGVTRVQYTQGRKPGPQKGTHHKKYDDQGNIIPRKSGVKPGTKRSEINKDGTTRKKPGVKPGTKRGLYNKDGGLRKKPGPKAKNI